MKALPDKALRFIPYRKQDLVDMCLQDDLLSGQEEQFRKLFTILSSIYHFEFHSIIESMKDAYAPVDPDADTLPYENINSAGQDVFVELLNGLLEKANYERISEEDLNQALVASSLFKINLHVDFDEFSEVLLFCRGESIRKETITSWMGLFSKTIQFTNYDRVVVYLKFKSADKNSEGTESAPATLTDSTDGFKPGSTLLKLFQNVPKADLEMLFPNTRVRMRTMDKLLIGIPALISGGIVLTTKMGASLVLVGSLLGFWLGFSHQPVELNQAALIALLAGLGALGGYLWKQFNSFKNRKLQFMQELTKNLYFKNLDNNAGVFYRLANDAEEEECKEALLAYYFLLVSEQALSAAELDQKIEHWLSSKWQAVVDFEIEDALGKLIDLGLLQESAGQFSAIALEDAIEKLDQRWDNYFVSGAADLQRS